MIESLNTRWVVGGASGPPSFVSKDEICFPCGSFIKVINVHNNEERLIPSQGGGIGCIAADPVLKVIAVTELTLEPNIEVFEYPQFNSIGILEKGSQLDYICLEFAFDEILISLGGIPDFMLTVWRWTTQEKLCSVKNTVPSSALQTKVPMLSASANPSLWGQICVTQPDSIMLFETERCARKFTITKILCTLPVEEEREGTPLSSEDHSTKLSHFLHLNDFHMKNNMYGALNELPLAASMAMPDSVLSGYLDSVYVRKRVVPTCHCWLTNRTVLVCCADGSVLKVDSEKHLVHKAYRIKWPVENKDSEDGGPVINMALHTKGLFLAGRGGIVMMARLSDEELKVIYVFNVGHTVGAIQFNMDYKLLSIWCLQGLLYLHDAEKDQANFSCIWNKKTTPFVGIDCFGISSSCLMTVRKNGVVEKWNLETAAVELEFSIGQEAECLACSPLCCLLVVASAIGFLFFYELMENNQHRVIKIIRLFNNPVITLHFDRYGQYLLAIGKPNELYILGGCPSSCFEVCGHTEFEDQVMNISTLITTGTIHVIVMSQSGKDVQRGQNVIIISVPMCLAWNPKKYWKDQLARFNDELLKKWVTKLHSYGFGIAVHPDSDAFLFCSGAPHQLQKINFFKKDRINYDVAKPDALIESGHLLKGNLVISHDCTVLASISDDGKLCVRDISQPEQIQSIIAHHYWEGKRGSHICFSADDAKIITSGEDGCLVCHFISKSCLLPSNQNSYDKKIKVSILNDEEKGSSTEFVGYQDDCTLDSSLFLSSRNRENESKFLHKVHSTLSEGEIVKKTDVEHPTWYKVLEQKQNERQLEEFSAVRNSIVSEINGIQSELAELMEENDALPESERLPVVEIALNPFAYAELQSEAQIKLKEEEKKIEKELSELKDQVEKLKSECWNKMETKAYCLIAFHSGLKIYNYPLFSRSEEELNELARVIEKRKFQNFIQEKRFKIKAEEQERDKSIKDGLPSTYSEFRKDTSWSGSQRDKCGVENELLYSQFEVITSEQKVDQIVLLKDIIYRIKCKFNEKFDVLLDKKKREVSHVESINTRIEDIRMQLGLDRRIWSPKWDPEEIPDTMFELRCEEIMSHQLYPTEESTKPEPDVDEEKLMRKEALEKMMYGVIEGKKEEQLNKPPDPPTFMKTKEPKDYTIDEIRAAKQYEELLEKFEQNSAIHKHQLQGELQELTETIMKCTNSFDMEVEELHSESLFIDCVICQEELLIRYLSLSVAVEAELLRWECYIQQNIYVKETSVGTIHASIQEAREMAKQAQDAYEFSQNSMQISDYQAKQELKNLPNKDLLLFHYKNKPKIMRRIYLAAMKENPYYQPNVDTQLPLSTAKCLQALDEFDSDKPETIDQGDWDRMCQLRRMKYQAEIEILEQSQIAADTMQYVDLQQQKLILLQDEIKSLTAEKNRVTALKNAIRTDVWLQLVIPNGSIEVETVDYITDFSNANLLHVAAIEQLNESIKTLGKLKIATLIEGRGTRENILSYGEKLENLKTEIEELQKNINEISSFILTRKMRSFLAKDKAVSLSHEKEKFLQAIEVRETLNAKQLLELDEKHAHLIKMIAKTENENKILRLEIEKLHRKVGELQVTSGMKDPTEEAAAAELQKEP